MPSELNLSIRRCIAVVRVDRLDHLHRLGVEHRKVRVAAREAVARFRVHDRAVAAAVEDFAERLEGLEIEDSDAAGRRLRGRRAVRGSDGAHGVARDVEPAVGGVGEDVVGAALAADFRSHEHLVRTIGARLLGADRERSACDRDGGCGDEAFHRRRFPGFEMD